LSRHLSVLVPSVSGCASFRIRISETSGSSGNVVVVSRVDDAVDKQE
jgi:hypothetical protein